MPSLVICVEENVYKDITLLDLKSVEHNLNHTLINELQAKKENCQVVWISSKIVSSKYKIFGELKFRDTKIRDNMKKQKCLKNIGEILKNAFKVDIRLRSFAINNSSITALDL